MAPLRATEGRSLPNLPDGHRHTEIQALRSPEASWEESSRRHTIDEAKLTDPTALEAFLETFLTARVCFVASDAAIQAFSAAVTRHCLAESLTEYWRVEVDLRLFWLLDRRIDQYALLM
jgi:hypothetical protein